MANWRKTNSGAQGLYSIVHVPHGVTHPPQANGGKSAVLLLHASTRQEQCSLYCRVRLYNYLTKTLLSLMMYMRRPMSRPQG